MSTFGSGELEARLARPLSLLTVLFVGSLVSIGVTPSDFRWIACAGAALLATAIGLQSWKNTPRHALAFFVIALGLGLSFALPIAPVCGLIALFAVRREALGRVFAISHMMRLIAGIFAVLAGLGVMLWNSTQSWVLRFYLLPEWASAGIGLWILIIASAVANSIYEEVLWRFLLPRALGGHTVVLSIGFGLSHINSLPSGLSGVLLTTAFAVAAHWIVSRSGGSILTTMGAHFVADVVLLGAILT